MVLTVEVTHEAGTPLQEWLGINPPQPEMYFNDAFWSQVMFVRDNLTPAVYPTFENWNDNPVRVVGTHTSKSIVLPVYSIRLPDKGEVRIRGNFHNWVVSVRLNEPVEDNFLDLFERRAEQLLVYSEGFEPRWVFPPYAENQSEFSFTLHDQYQLYTFFYLLAAAIGIRSSPDP